MNPAPISDGTRYRLLIVDTDVLQLWVKTGADGPCLPEVFIARHGRTAWELQRTCRMHLHIHILVIRFLPIGIEGTRVRYVLVELLDPIAGGDWRTIPLSYLAQSDLCQESGTFEGVLVEEATDRFSRIGWIDPVLTWVESSAGRRISSKAQIEQFNAGTGFSLLRLPMEDGQVLWFKATGEPNQHELRVTEYLSIQNAQTAPYLPSLVGRCKEWNAWLMAGDAVGLPEIPTDPAVAFPILSDAVVSLARLQIATVSGGQRLLELGAFDQSLERLHSAAPRLFDYLETAMADQSSTRVPQLESTRLVNLCRSIEDSCKRLLDLDLPTGLLHGDLNRGNILRHEHCVFIDWSEAYVGLPFVCLQHLLLLNRIDDDRTRNLFERSLRTLYRDEWAGSCNPRKIDQALGLMPLLAPFSALYGRGDWLLADEPGLRTRFGYARTLARHMDRAARYMEQEAAG